ncbi:hypothetical protein FRC18_002031 [Serendipita sp. 400]|nr:hypothetical protein FRC18_002031 [Serendipita sp. 400]
MRIFTENSVFKWLCLLALESSTSSFSSAQQQHPISAPFPPLTPSAASASLPSVRNETDNLIFASVSSLLQQWPNTLRRNGHTIVRGTIPVGTILYHARGDRHVPDVPEWTGTNVEHSYALCPSDCWMITLAVEEELNIVYFDGSSAAKSILGHLDTQDMLVWGKIRPEKCLNDEERLDFLCEWGAKYGLDAFVRMEPGFEVMICDFRRKMKTVSILNIMGSTRSPRKDDLGQSTDLALVHRQRQITKGIPKESLENQTETETHISGSPPALFPSLHPCLPFPPGHPPPPPPRQPLPPHWQGPLRDRQSVHIELLLAAAWNNHNPGEIRVKLDYSRLVTFYDPTFTSLVKARKGLDRNHHRLLSLSPVDYHTALARLDEDLSRPTTESSGIDWRSVLRTVTDRYGDRIWLLKDSLDRREQKEANSTEVASHVRLQVFVMLMQYLIHGAVPPDDDPSSGGRDREWLEPITTHCASALTAGINPSKLTRSERLIKQSIDGVLHRICSTLTGVWADTFSVLNLPDEKVGKLLKGWSRSVNELVDWLDWPMWHTCRPACPEQMFCYIPTWPFGVPWEAVDPDSIDMTPRCIDRTNAVLHP